ncbi:MAG: hypothetical protein KAI24_06545 [Planctomycetes bacterium]|nr:hypothetical protein [Planctomycetota bacterium]
MKTHRYVPVLLVPVLSFASCAEGGEEDRPQSQVKIAAQHHMFALRSLAGFGQFPVPANAVQTDRGLLNLFDDSTYTVTRATGTSGADRYALEDDGTFSVYVTGSGSEPSQVFLGGYGLVGNAPDYFFTDRVTSNGSPRIGMFFGTRLVTGQVELEGAWHVLSLHVVFDQTILAPSNVGRGAHGAVSITAGAPGTQRTISGTGFQGTSALTLGGTIQNLLDAENNGTGAMNLTLDYQLSGQAADSRIIEAAGTGNVIFGVDENSGDGEAGLVAMVRKFDAPTTPVDSVRVPGTFLVGGQTLFVNPSNSGSDTFVGTVTLTPQGGFRLDATGNTGADFSYIGTYALAADGGLTISISGTNETWFGAIDKSYNSFVFIDDFEELRSNNIPELNFGFGVREKTGT